VAVQAGTSTWIGGKLQLSLKAFIFNILGCRTSVVASQPLGCDGRDRRWWWLMG